MEIQLETERLLMKQMCEADAEGMFELNNDPEVVLYTGDTAFANIDETLQFIRNYDQFEKYRMGHLNMFLKETGDYLGWCGLKYLAVNNHVDLGYRLHKRYWGKGYATEAAIASLNYGFNTLHLKEIIATAMSPNTASVNIMKKLGMAYSQNTDDHGQECVVYKIIKDQWK